MINFCAAQAPKIFIEHHSRVPRNYKSTIFYRQYAGKIVKKQLKYEMNGAKNW